MTQKIIDLHAVILTCLTLLFNAVKSFSLNFKLHYQKTRTLKVIFTFDLQNRQLLTESDLSDFTLFVKTTIEKKK